jgi:hypothetical protein
MTIRETLDHVLQGLPDHRLQEVLNFARFVSMEDEAKEWAQFGLDQFARAFDPDEPEYTAADPKPEFNGSDRPGDRFEAEKRTLRGGALSFGATC